MVEAVADEPKWSQMESHPGMAEAIGGGRQIEAAADMGGIVGWYDRKTASNVADVALVARRMIEVAQAYLAGEIGTIEAVRTIGDLPRFPYTAEDELDLAEIFELISSQGNENTME